MEFVFLKRLYYFFFLTNFQLALSQHLPFIKDNMLFHNNLPYTILGGELGNSTVSTATGMVGVWNKLKTMHLNTLLLPVYWERVEPEPGKFDFSRLKTILKESEEHKIKLIILWFGTWKNSMSTYVPTWIKLDDKKYPKTQNQIGENQEILSPFSDEVLAADLNAFKHLMEFLKKEDPKGQRVLMVQVENEIGMLSSARDHHKLANQAFQSKVPEKLIAYLKKNKEKLTPELYNHWAKFNFRTKGNWEEIFGKSLATDELFMAWYFAHFVNTLVEVGKAIHPIPMFVNAALNHRPGKKPGEYPSAGPLPHLMDIWKAAAPQIDFLAPDYYTPDFTHWAELYVRQNDPLFVPEHQFDLSVGPKAIYAIGHFNAIGFSPFAIESTSPEIEENLSKAYSLLHQIEPLIKNQPNVIFKDAVLLEKEQVPQQIKTSSIEFTFRHGYTLPWTQGKTLSSWPTTSAIVLQTKKNEFYIAGTGAVATVSSHIHPEKKVGLLEVELGHFEEGKWKVDLYLNGDQTHQGRHLSIPVNEYQIQRVTFYTY